ncbi:MAG: gliding motility-associated ABC transporter substrate-binding protein GldG [Bacteroidetes bacterium]|nr:MAG: gliding motility-associated ABC transporter substrate-binding protein GldG [Bacteroidota bacterium]
MKEIQNTVLENKIVKKINVRRHNVISLLVGLLIIVAVNMIGSRYFKRIDLTSERRFTLTDATRDLLRDLDDIVYFRIYLEGDFPAGFRRLRNQTREMLDEFRAYSGFIQYEFINPTVKGDWELTEENYRMLAGKGLQPTQVQVTAEDASSQQIIFPGALVSYRGREIPLSLLQDQLGLPSEEVLNNSAQALEYNLATTIHKLTVAEKPRVAFHTGNDELELRYVADITFELEDFYYVDRLPINGDINTLQDFSTLIIAQPMREFSEADKFVIDQFIMNGGSVLWLIDPVYASMDSLQVAPETLGMPWQLNLDDMLFRYGVRLNTDLVKDLQSVPIPITTGFIGDRPQISLVPWFYFPLVRPATNHPIVRNLNPVRTEFVSTIDTVGSENIRKTILLQTSPYTRIMQTPVRISFDIMQQQVDESLYRQGSHSVAVLLEGQFESVFRNRRIPEGVSIPEGFEMKNTGTGSRMIVVSDGDVIRNQFGSQGEPLPLGYDRFLNETFGNRDFILNAVNYLNDDRGIMEARAREIRLRALDRSLVNRNRLTIQVFNVGLPVLLVVVFGSLRFFLRKRKFNKKIV